MDDKALPTLETERLVLRPMVEADIPNIVKYGEDPEVFQFLPDKSYAYDAEWIGGHQKAFEDRTRATFAIALKSDTTNAIGLGVVIFDQCCMEVGEVGYWVAKHLWGKGIATEAAKRLLRWGFDQLKFEVIAARCVPENVGSIKVLKNIGMKYEGCLRSRTKKGGHFEDLSHFSILRSEYVEAKK